MSTHCVTLPIPNQMLCVVCCSRQFTPREPLGASAKKFTMAGTVVPDVSVDEVLSALVAPRTSSCEPMNARTYTDRVTTKTNIIIC